MTLRFRGDDDVFDIDYDAMSLFPLRCMLLLLMLCFYFTDKYAHIRTNTTTHLPNGNAEHFENYIVMIYFILYIRFGFLHYVNNIFQSVNFGYMTNGNMCMCDEQNGIWHHTNSVHNVPMFQIK